MDPSFVHRQFPTSYVRTKLDPDLQGEHASQDEAGSATANQEMMFDTSFLEVDSVKGEEGWVGDINNPDEDFLLWLRSLPSPLSFSPFTPRSFTAQGVGTVVSVPPKDEEASQQLLHTPFDELSLSPTEIDRMGDELIAQLDKTPITQDEREYLLSLPINVTLDSLVDKEPTIPSTIRGDEVEPKDGMSMNIAIKDTRRPPSTSHVSRSTSPKSLTLKPLQFDSATNRWPLPPIQSVTHSFWDPIRDALREQVRIEKMEDTEDWIKQLPNATEMLEPETDECRHD
ncbi:hypothetical protein MferCBS31731_001121 [Microsporum ferrugineum]